MKKINDLYQLKNSLKNDIFVNYDEVQNFVEEAINIIMPGMSKKCFKTLDEFQNYIDAHKKVTINLLNKMDSKIDECNSIALEYIENLHFISNQITDDAKALFAGDPAAKSINEVILSYPGLQAMAYYRLGHFFYKKNVPIIPRMISEYAHAKTGIDIHPGASIGHSCFIDHGTGVVIGETAIIGNRVKIYQGVTLGALSVDKTMQNQKRHPTIGDDCVLYAHATILGGETIVGEGSIIGGNVWITKSIPANSIVYHQSTIKLDKKKGFDQEEELTYEI